MVVLQSMVHERAPMLDKSHTTYETTRWLVSFIVAYNPGAVSFADGALPTARRGVMPVNTDQAIRDYLEEPRGDLVVRSDSDAQFSPSQLTNPANNPRSLVIVSPAGNRTCDVRNGPFCKVNSIQFIPGERLWKIHLTFETYVTTAKHTTNSTPTRGLILNNRWSVQSDIDWQHMTTRIYQGICTVNANLLNDPAFNPNIAGYRTGIMDSIRQAFAGFSCPGGFQRTFVKVEMTPDGNNAVYVVRDEQRHYNQPNYPNVPRVEVQDSNWMSQGGTGKMLLDYALNAPAPSIADAAALIAAPWLSGPTMAIQHGRAAGIAFLKNLPKYRRTIIVRVWGNKLTSRNQLVTIALQVGQARMGNPAVINTATTDMTITGDSNRNITLNYTMEWSTGDTLLLIGGTPALSVANFFSPGFVGGPGGANWRDSIAQELEVSTAGGFVITNFATRNPPMGGTGGLDGSRSVSTNVSIAPMITQVLEEFGQAPGSPP